MPNHELDCPIELLTDSRTGLYSPVCGIIALVMGVIIIITHYQLSSPDDVTEL